MISFAIIAAQMGWQDTSMFDSTEIDKSANPFVGKGILVPTQPVYSIRCPCGGDHTAEVERSKTDDCKMLFTAFCGETGIPYTVDRRELIRWQVDVMKIMKLIQKEFACPGEPECRCHRLWYLGESGRPIAECRRQIFFATQLTKEVEDMLPDGTSQILIMGECNPLPTKKFQDRIFQMHDILSFDDHMLKMDKDLIRSRLQKIELAEKAKAIVVPKNAVQKSREEIIKDFLVERTKTLRDSYWTAAKKKKQFKLPRRPSCQEIADYIKVVTHETQTPNQSTVNRTIIQSTDKELLLIWAGITDITFVRDYKRRKKQTKPKDSDDDYIREIFSQTELDPFDEGIHTV